MSFPRWMMSRLLTIFQSKFFRHDKCSVDTSIWNKGWFGGLVSLLRWLPGRRSKS
jgi:hypothetical protein